MSEKTETPETDTNARLAALEKQLARAIEDNRQLRKASQRGPAQLRSDPRRKLNHHQYATTDYSHGRFVTDDKYWEQVEASPVRDNDRDAPSVTRALEKWTQILISIRDPQLRTKLTERLDSLRRTIERE